MSCETKSEARLRAIDHRLTRLRAERGRLAARVSHTERKRDTRRKILVGASVLVAVEQDGVPAFRNARELLEWLDTRLTRPHDRVAFDFARRVRSSTDV